MNNSIHLYGQLLPESEHTHVQQDDQNELRKLMEVLDELDSSINDTIDSIKFGKCFRLIRTRIGLKYSDNDAVTERILQVLYKLYTTKRTSVVQRKSIMNIMHLLCKKNPDVKGFVFNWKLLWTEARETVLRLNRSESVSNPHVTAELCTAIIEFLHSARYLLGNQDAVAVVADAMAMLDDVRNPACYEGLLLLINCLPTNFHLYDEYLPQWVSIWSNLSHNPQWDCCWLTLFTRARKHSKTFDWMTLSPLLYAKAKELIVPIERPKGSSQLFSIPEYYKTLLVIAADAKTIAMNKLSKLMYFMTLIDPGQANMLSPCSLLTLTPSTAASVLKGAAQDFSYPGYQDGIKVHKSATELALFYQSIRSCVHPSCNGAWTQPLGVFTATMISEISRNLGRNIAFNLASQAAGNVGVSGLALNPNKRRFQASVHLPTIRFLLGMLSVVVMEGVYGKAPTVTFFYISSLKNLMTVDPSLAEYIIPYMLAPLHPDAVSQSHQTPIALQALWVCMKPLLSPHPLFVKHIPSMLKLLLPGVDPNDRIKTCSTLNVVVTLLSHIPIRTDYSELVRQSPLEVKPYLSLVSTTERTEANDECNKWITGQLSDYQSAFETLGAYWSEWLPLFVDKIFSLLDAEEVKQKGAKPSPVSESVAECMDMLFGALQNSDLLKLVSDAILSHFSRALPVNAVKTAGKMFQSLVGRRPGILGTVLHQLLESNSGGLANGSVEKLAFRLRLAGGAVRNATTASVSQHLPLLLPYLQSEYMHHKEKAVRKASSKLAKDLLKGSCGWFLRTDSPSDGFGVIESLPKVNWHVPDAASLKPVLGFLRNSMESSMNEVRRLLAAACGNTEEGSKTVSKVTEEAVVVHLKLLSRLLRGAADMIYDDEECSNQQESLIHSGREELINRLDSDDKAFLSTIRIRILSFLTEIHNQVDTFSAAESMALIGSPATPATPASTTSNLSCARDLGNSSALRAKWVKLFRTAVSIRFHTNQNADNALKYLKLTKRMVRSMLCSSIYREIKRFELPDSVSSANSLLSVSYWKFHNQSASNIRARAFVLKVKRAKEFAHASLKKHLSLAESPFAVTLMGCLQQLGNLCGHEYDDIRARSSKAFLEVTSFFGMHRWMNEIVKPMMISISNPVALAEKFPDNNGDTSRSSRLTSFISGVLHLLSQNKVLDKVVQSWELTDAFLHSLRSAPAVISMVDETDKRERLLGALTEAMVAYTSKYNNAPIRGEIGEDGTGLVGTTLQALGYDPDVGSSIPAPSYVVAASGLRLEAHASFMLLHLIGHSDIPIMPGVVAWAIRTLSTSHGQPSQPLAMAAFIRLVCIASTRGLPADSLALLKATLALTASSSSEDHAQVVTHSQTPPPARPASAPPTPDAVWLGLLQGVSACHTRPDEGNNSAQWTRGIGRLISSTVFLRSVAPRTLYSVLSDQSGSLVLREHCLTFTGLFTLLLVDSQENGSNPSDDVVARVRTLLKYTLNLPSHNEDETRANNATRAEVFSGLYRVLLTHRRHFGEAGVVGGALESVLIGFMTVQLERLSYEYSRDWAVGILYALLGVDDAFGDGDKGTVTPCSLVTNAIEGLRQVLVASSNQDSGMEADSDGFMKNDKILLLANAVLQGSLGSNIVGKTKGIGAAAQAALAVFQSPELQAVSGYNSTRTELYSLVTVLAEMDAHNTTDVSSLLQHLVSAHAEALTAVEASGSANNPNEACVASEVEVDDEMLLNSAAVFNTGSTTTATLVRGKEGNTKAVARFKNVLECACAWVNNLISHVPQWKYEAFVAPLLGMLVVGAAHPHPEVAQRCQGTAVRFCQQVRPRVERNRHTASAATNSIFTIMLDVVVTQAANASVTVRRTVLQCLVSILSAAWTHLDANDRKRLKDTLSELVVDDKPEVSNEAVSCMSAYLLRKSSTELASLAQVFMQNSDVLVTKEKKKRKTGAGGGDVAVSSSSRPDKQYLTTFMMLTCLLLSFPFDLPAFLPGLISAYLKHSFNPSVRDTLTRTIRTFRKGHQDRWEEFQHKFSREQLDDLQGAGAAHYFS